MITAVFLSKIGKGGDDEEDSSRSCSIDFRSKQ